MKNDAGRLEYDGTATRIKHPLAITVGLVLLFSLVAGWLQANYFHHQHLVAVADEELNALTAEIDGKKLEPVIAATRRLSQHKVVAETAAGRMKPDNGAVLGILDNARFLLSCSLVYILDSAGNTVACTPYANGSKTLTGKNYSFRPYFTEPMRSGEDFSYIAVGVTTGKRGLYYASAITLAGKRVGVVIVKTALTSIDKELSSRPWPCALISDDGVVIAANRSNWKYHNAFPMSVQTRRRLLNSHQFANRQIAALPIDLSNDRVTIAKQSYLVLHGRCRLDSWRVYLLFPATMPPPWQIALYIVLTAAALLLLVITAVAIRSRRRSMLKLKTSEANYRSMVDNLPAAFFRVDTENNVVITSPALLELAGAAKQDDILGRQFDILWDDRRQYQEFIEEISGNAKVHNFECTLKKLDGSCAWTLLSATFFFDANGHRQGMEGVFYDISLRKKMREQIKILTEAVRVSAHAIFLTDIDGNIQWVNEAVTRQTGYSAEEVIGQNPRLLNANYHDREFFHHMWETILKGEVWRGELKNRRKDGVIIDVEMTITPVFDDAGHISNFIAVKTDVSERKRSEEERTRRLINERITTEIARSLLGGKINKGEFDNVVGKIRQVTGSRWIIIFRKVTAADNEVCVRRISASCNTAEEYDRLDGMFSGPVCLNDTQWLESMYAGSAHVGSAGVISDGGEHPLNSVTMLSIPFFCAEHWGGLLAMDSTDGEQRWQDSDLSFLATIAEMIGSYFSNLETTQRLNREKEKAEQVNKVKSDFIANISHEIRTPINAITGMSHLALATDLNEKQREYLHAIESSSSHLLRIVDDLLDFSKISAGTINSVREDFYIREIVAAVVEAIKDKARGKQLQINVEILPPEYHLSGDSISLTRALLNVCENAVKFTSSGSISITVNSRLQAEQCVVSISVADTGIGITPQARANLFKPFSQADSSSTREHGGTGMGLAVAAQLLAAMGGEIVLESTSSSGSVFTVTAPFSLYAEQVGSAEEVADVSLGDISVLLVVQGAFNRALLEELLLQQQMQVTCCTGIDEVEIAAIARHDVVIADSGAVPELAQFAETCAPVPVIVVGGAEKEFDPRGNIHTLAVPLQPQTLSACIRGALERKVVVPPQSSTPALDTDLGLQRVVGNRELYARLLGNFNAEFGDVAKEIAAAWRQRDMATLKRVVHTLKGASGALGAMLVHDVALELENALTAAVGDAEVGAIIERLDQALQQLLPLVKQAAGLPEVKPAQSEVQTGSLPELQKMIMAVHPAIKQGRIADCRQLVDQLNDYTWPEPVRRQVEELVAALDDYDFVTAESLAATLIDM